ncbi:hypothetical protein NDU88_001569 [Pleurodeles waltl]|uniref:Uncharacterized protein n=1 Tax=Pleurodeles waltl TaxID=8319 RepID=A0AAV7SB76_PLEWA|nr:hypothetical protein NDU88_001569 [Pleurodeles waltl]
MNDKEASQRVVLSIGSLPKPRDLETVKGAGPPTQAERGRITWWRPKETERESREEQRRTRNEDDAETARTCLRQPGEQRESGVVWIRKREEDHWPGEHTNEPATLQENRGQASIDMGDREEKRLHNRYPLHHLWVKGTGNLGFCLER